MVTPGTSAASTDAVPLVWTVGAKRSLVELLAYLSRHPSGNPVACARAIFTAIEPLRRTPTMYPVRHVRQGRAFRRLVVRGQFLVYYIYFPPRSSRVNGKVSIRGVKHGATRRPFAGVREHVGRPFPPRDMVVGATDTGSTS